MVQTNSQTRLAMRLTKVSSATLVAATLLSASVAQAQTAPSDSRWQVFAGCWQPIDPPESRASSGTMVCVVPVANSRTVNVASISNGQITHVERLAATGERVAKTVDGCAGWETASWSKDGHRLFIRSEFGCSNNLQVKGSTVFSITPEGNWAHVQGNTVGKNADARVTLFRLTDEVLAPDMALVDSAVVRMIAVDRTFADRMVRLAAAEPATVDGILEISRNVDKQVTQTWVAEFANPTQLSAKELVALSDAGMPSEVLDIMIAKANPERFALQANSAGTDGSRPTSADIARANGVNRNCLGMNSGYGGYYGSIFDRSFLNSSFDCPVGYGIGGYGMNIYGLGYGYGGFGGYGYGNYFRGSQPIIIVNRGSGVESPPQGRAVRGQGYTRDKSSAPSSSSSSDTRSSSGSSSGSSASGSSSSGSSSSGSSGGASTGRTAVPKTPPPSN